MSRRAERAAALAAMGSTDPTAGAAKRAERKQMLRETLGWAWWLITMIVITWLVWTWVWPSALGGHTSWVLVAGHSMEPTFHTGDLVLAQPQDNYKIGDVVVYRVPQEEAKGSQIVHRIVREEDGHWITRGDNRDTEDPWKLTDDDIVGRKVLLIPKFGVATASLRLPLVLGLLAAGAAIYLLWPLLKEDEDVEAAASGAASAGDTPGDVSPADDARPVDEVGGAVRDRPRVRHGRPKAGDRQHAATRGPEPAAIVGADSGVEDAST